MKSLRAWATPLTIGSFLIMGVTGSLMFFHLDSGLNKLVHEWAGWAIVAGVAAHVVLNWRAFGIYFRRPFARLLMAGSAVVLALSFYPASGGGSPVGAMMQALGKSDVQTVIALSGQPLETGLARLQAAGMQASADTEIAALTGGDRSRQMEVIQALFVD